MVVIAIIGILAMIAYPSYMQSVRSSNRSDAQTAVLTTANSLERFFATNGTYTINLGQLGLIVDGGIGYSENRHYTVVVAAGPSGNIATSYTIVAVPAAGDIQTGDIDCPQFLLDSLGLRVPDPAVSRCW